jgi:hypothetical protein
MTSQEARRTGLREALNDAFDAVMEGIEEQSVSRSIGDRILSHIATARALVDTHSGDDHDCKDSFTVPEQDVPLSWSKRP